MMKTNSPLILVIGILVASLVLSRIEVAYGLDVNPSDGNVRGLWRIADSPFHVKRDIVVPIGESLTIEPGVFVYFDVSCSLTVRGRLVATGTSGNRITFSWKEVVPDRDKWLGIYLQNTTSPSSISYCKILNAIEAISVYGSPNNVITYNTIVLSATVAISVFESPSNLITFNSISSNGAGILVTGSEGTIITDNEISDNTEYGICLSQGCRKTEISRNLIHKTGTASPPPYVKGHGIRITGTGDKLNRENKIRDNIISNSHIAGIRLDHIDNIEISGNLIFGSAIGTGLFIQDGINVRITSNDIFLNTYAGIVVSSGASFIQFYGNDVKNNGVFLGQAVDEGTTNRWDDGSRGNYWSDYFGVDMNNDGIGDSPYTLNGTKASKDYFPLMSPRLFIARTVSTTTTMTSTSVSTSYVFTTTRIDTSSTAATTTLVIVSPSIIWTVSSTTSITSYQTNTILTGTTITATSVSTWLTTVSTTSSTTTVSTTSTIVTATQGRCFIASAAYGSELAEPVQSLRDFRDKIVTSSFSGTQFMKVFNAFYYSFSPTVADHVASSPSVAMITRGLLYPMVEALRLASLVACSCGLPLEIAVIIVGILSSSIIGVAYLGAALLVVSHLKSIRVDEVLELDHWSGTLNDD